MANTTSGTATFDKTFAIDEIVEEAYQRIGVTQLDGYQIKSARRSINIMFQEWGNRGLHYWEIDETNIDLIENQNTYTFSRPYTPFVGVVTELVPSELALKKV